MVCIRHAMGHPKFSFNCSDLYVVIALTPENNDITQCEREIAASQWMDFSEYLQHPKVHDMNRNFLRTFIDYREKGIRIDCQDHVHQILKRDYKVYLAKKD